MRAAVDREDAPGAEQGWLSWLTDCGIPAITDLDTRALVRHIRDQGAMRGGLFPAAIAESEARELIERRALDDRPRPRPRGDARASRPCSATERPSGPRIAMIDTGVKLSIVRNLRAAGRDRRAAPMHRRRRGADRQRPRRDLPRQRPRRPGRARLHRRDRPGARRQAARVRDLPRPSAALPRGRPRHLQAAVRPPRRQPSGQGPDDRADRDHEPEPRLRGARPGRRARRSTPTSRSAGRPTSAPPS